MNKRINLSVIVTLLMISTLIQTIHIQPVLGEPRTWTVDDDGSADFNTIQDTINAAVPGDRIIFYPDIYYENVMYFKNYLTINSLEGAENSR